LQVEQNRLPLDVFALPPDATVLLPGAAATPDPLPLLEKMETFLSAGGRLVIATGPCRNNSAYCDEQVDGPDQIEEDEKEARTRMDFERMDWLSRRWGFDLERLEFGEPTRPAMLHPDFAASGLAASFPPSLPWASTLYFSAPAQEWQVLYTRDDKPVLMERAWGNGSIVMASDTYFLSNEALRTHRAPALLAWLIGPHRRVIFDESHHGLIATPGLMDLLVAMRLHALLFAFAALGLLFAWMGLVGHASRREASPAETARTQGRDALSSMTALLRRAIPRQRLLEHCIQEFERTAHLLPPNARERAHDARKLLDQNPQNLPETYRRIRRHIQENR